MRTCEATINLRTPVASERVRGFQPPWRTVYVYRCACGAEHRVRATAFRGKRPEPGVGGIRCGNVLLDDNGNTVGRFGFEDGPAESLAHKIASGLNTGK